MTDFDTIRAAMEFANKYRTDGNDRQFQVALAALSRVEAAAEQTEKALAVIVMAEPLEVDGRTMWPSFSGELQNKAAVALLLLRGKDTG